ncbi:MAG: peptidoglycan DD-metalloendopeptidase family protein [Patescibacteria group bacterium]
MKKDSLPPEHERNAEAPLALGLQDDLGLLNRQKLLQASTRSSVELMLQDPYPLLGELSEGQPFTLDLSDDSILDHALLTNQTLLQAYINKECFTKKKWGIGGYMEYRSVFLGYFPQGDQKRFYHLGLDVTAPAQTPIHAPLDGIVFQSGHEEGEGNYGGFVVLQHERKDDAPLYSFYGHLDKNSQPIVGQKIQKGGVFARLGDMDSNGHWFYHIHFQLLTQRGVDEGWMERGNCTKGQLATIHELCPVPHTLFTPSMPRNSGNRDLGQEAGTTTTSLD